jgi:DNA polymerase-4
MQAALAHDAAPMRIPFNRIPDGGSEQEAENNALWLQSLNRFKAMAEGEHRRREKERSVTSGGKPSLNRD